MSKKISIVVCAYNHLDYTINTLTSLLDSTKNDKNYTYLFSLYDDCSTDETENYIKSNFKQIFYYKESTNKGFNNLCNKAYEMNKDNDYLIILNNDLKFSKNWAKILLDNLISENAKAGGPVTNAPGQQIKQNIKKFIKSYIPDDNQEEINKIASKNFNQRNFKVSYISGFCMAFDIKWLNTLKSPVFTYKDPNFGLEKSFFIKNHPCNPIVIPSSFVFHYKQVTVDRTNLAKEHYRIFDDTKNNKLAIGIFSYKNSKNLNRCLDSLVKQNHTLPFDIIILNYKTKNFDNKKIPPFNSRSKKVSIIYNDYPIERISVAKNKFVEVAKEKYDYLIFIDDNKIAEKKWLNNLFKIIIKYNADVILGSFSPIFNKEIPQWVIDGNFLGTNQEKRETGDILNIFDCNNVIIKTRVFKKNNPPFNGKFESIKNDLYFFNNLYKNNNIIKFCSEAILYKEIERKHLTLYWNLMHEFKLSSLKASSLKLNKNYKKIVKKISYSIIKLILASFYLFITILIYPLGYKKYLIQSVKELFIRFGFIFGILNLTYKKSD